MIVKPHPDDEFKVKRRPLNLRNLIGSRAVRITYPGDGSGDFVKDEDPSHFSIVTYMNEHGKDGSVFKKWPNKPNSVALAESIINQSKPNLGEQGLLGDEKYLQILESAKKLGLDEKQIFLDER